MFILGADIVFCCNDDFDIYQNGAIVCENNAIIDIGEYKTLTKKYKYATATYYKDSILLPALINSHIHFEFSANMGSFKYGAFGAWLDSIMQNRIEVLNKTDFINGAIMEQKQNGVGCVCAISSYDIDFDSLIKSKLKVIYAIETIGSIESNFIDQILFLSHRLENALKHKSDSFIPALAIHAPYSVHYKLAEYILELARKYNLLVSSHFLESIEELMWLENSTGYFRTFFKNYFSNENAKSFFSPNSFLDLFYDVRAIFTHCLFLPNDIKEQIEKIGNIVSCPKSNLLLNAKMGKNHIIATDGKSSNNNVSLLDEMRIAFFHALNFANHKNLFNAKQNIMQQNMQNKHEEIAKNIIKAVTINPAKALGLNNGTLKIGNDADLAIFNIDGLDFTKDMASHFILHAKNAHKLFVNGCEIYSAK